VATSRIFRLQVLGAALLFSTGGAAIKACSLGAWQVASLRSGIAALTLLLLIPAARRGWSWRSLLVGAAYAVTMILYVAGNKLTTAASTIFLQSTAPFYLLILAPWLLREPLRRRDLGIMAALGTGLVMLVLGTDPPAETAPDPVLGNLLAAVAGLTWALTLAGIRWLSREARGAESAGLSAVVTGNVLAFLVCLPAVFPLGASGADWGLLVFLGAIQIGLAYVFLTTGMRHVPAFEASLLLLLEPVLNPVWAWLVHGERPGAWSLAGGAVILATTALHTWMSARRARRPGATA
jgi:drug/metabolite transporter (DMT)-like permease